MQKILELDFALVQLTSQCKSTFEISVKMLQCGGVISIVQDHHQHKQQHHDLPEKIEWREDAGTNAKVALSGLRLTKD